MTQPHLDLPADIDDHVQAALTEDIGTGDITARLIPAHTLVTAHIVCKESAMLCGKPWVDAVFHQVDANLQLQWHCAEGSRLGTGHRVVSITGNARAILTAERTALNFLQTLSGTATISAYYAKLVAHTNTRLLDTRKTLPGLRTAQKYAVRIGGCYNHRMGLYDAFLIKENHIAACGSIKNAVSTARAHEPGKAVEIEVKNLAELQEAIDVSADIVMLDNFSLDDISKAVTLTAGRLKLEASGGIDEDTLVKVAKTGVDYISIGALTKHCKAIDFSLLVDEA